MIPERGKADRGTKLLETGVFSHGREYRSEQDLRQAPVLFVQMRMIGQRLERNRSSAVLQVIGSCDRKSLIHSAE